MAPAAKELKIPRLHLSKAQVAIRRLTASSPANGLFVLGAIRAVAASNDPQSVDSLIFSGRDKQGDGKTGGEPWAIVAEFRVAVD